jgi:hypothetical protein
MNSVINDSCCNEENLSLLVKNNLNDSISDITLSKEDCNQLAIWLYTYGNNIMHYINECVSEIHSPVEYLTQEITFTDAFQNVHNVIINKILKNNEIDKKMYQCHMLDMILLHKVPVHWDLIARIENVIQQIKAAAEQCSFYSWPLDNTILKNKWKYQTHNLIPLLTGKSNLLLKIEESLNPPQKIVSLKHPKIHHGDFHITPQVICDCTKDYQEDYTCHYVYGFPRRRKLLL